jgi:E3 ubiquitin-protein ligase listerin
MLRVGTLFREAHDTMNRVLLPEVIAPFFPELLPWGEALAPFLQKPPSLALAVLRPFAGAVFLVSDSKNISPSIFLRDTKGYSVALRMALFTTHLLGLDELTRILPQTLQAQYLYLLALTYELVNDQIDLLENHNLFESHMDPDSMEELRTMLQVILATLTAVARNAGSWRREAESLPAHDTSRTVRQLIDIFLKVSRSLDPQGYYAGKALSRFLEILGTIQDWAVIGGDEWLSQLGIMNSTTPNIFGVSAILIGFGDCLRPHKAINTLCNRLVSDIAVASPNGETLQKLVLLNSCLAIYTKDEAQIPVAQIRLISVVKQILSWSEALATTHVELGSEACHALHLLLPAIKDVYGSYWQDALNLSAAIWSADGLVCLSDVQLPAVGMSLKLVSILQSLADANDDLADALVQSNTAISSGMINLLKLGRLKDNLPLQFVDNLLIRQVAKIDTASISDSSGLYGLVWSDFRIVQSAAFDVLQKVLVKAQDQISLEAALAGTSKFNSRSFSCAGESKV